MDNELKTQKWLTDEIKFILQFGSVIVAIVLGWASLSTQSELQGQRLTRIETNDLVHMQASLDRIEQQHMELLRNIVEIQTILKQQ